MSLNNVILFSGHSGLLQSLQFSIAVGSNPSPSTDINGAYLSRPRQVEVLWSAKHGFDLDDPSSNPAFRVFFVAKREHKYIPTQEIINVSTNVFCMFLFYFSSLSSVHLYLFFGRKMFAVTGTSGSLQEVPSMN